MKKVILFDDGNAIALAIEKHMKAEGFYIDVYRDGINKFSIDRFIEKPTNFIKSKAKFYDAMIIAPMYFEYDFGKKVSDTCDMKVFDKIMDHNLKFPTILMSNAFQFVKKGGAVINLLSTDYMWGSYISKYYSAVMSAKVSLIKSFGSSLGEKGIRVNGVGAGWVGDIITEDNYSEELKDLMIKNTPLKRMANSKEIVDVIEFLISEKASYINGQIINIDGGYGNVDVVTKREALSKYN